LVRYQGRPGLTKGCRASDDDDDDDDDGIQNNVLNNIKLIM
jgi:hypothetical protein